MKTSMLADSAKSTAPSAAEESFRLRSATGECYVFSGSGVDGLVADRLVVRRVTAGSFVIV